MEKDKVKAVIEGLRKEIGKTTAAIWATNPFKVLISTILSQRTKDEKTAKATKVLFLKYKNAKQISKAKEKDISKLIKSAGFYRQKAKRIKKVSKIILEKYNNEVPQEMDKLLKLPGVGRKTACCVLVYGYRKPAIPVDVHVHRISNRIRLVKTKTPEQTEIDLMEIVPKKYWIELNELMVKFGQRICKAKPECRRCPVVRYCSYGKKNLER